MVPSSRDLPTETAPLGDRLDPARRYLAGRRTLFVLVAFVCALALNWNWLVLAGMFSLLLALLSCIAIFAVDTGATIDNECLSSIAPDPSSRMADRATTD